MKLACFHLFNDYSGSPKVLKSVLKGVAGHGGCEIELMTSRGGVLDELKGTDGIRMRQYDYRFARNIIIRVLRYAWAQIVISAYALSYCFKRNVTFYINTILPIGPAIIGRLTGKRVIYHYHENAKAKSRFYCVLAWFMQHLAHEIICVSKYQSSFLARNKRVTVIPNALPQEFTDRLIPDAKRAFADKRVLMLGSLKGYKGTDEFIALARMLPDFSFELVLNEDSCNIEAYLKRNGTEPPANLTIHPRQDDVVPFYNRASLIVNLTDKERTIETFGLTALEAMSAGLPVIVPTVGGIAEMVENGVNGYKIDAKEIEQIAFCIKKALTDENLFITLANNALESSTEYNEQNMLTMINRIIGLPAEAV